MAVWNAEAREPTFSMQHRFGPARAMRRMCATMHGRSSSLASSAATDHLIGSQAKQTIEKANYHQCSLPLWLAIPILIQRVQQVTMARTRLSVGAAWLSVLFCSSIVTTVRADSPCERLKATLTYTQEKAPRDLSSVVSH